MVYHMLNSREKGSLLRNSFLRFSTTLLSHVHPTCPPETCLTLTQDFLLKMPSNSLLRTSSGRKVDGLCSLQADAAGQVL